MKKIIFYLIALFGLTQIISCNKDLNLQPIDQFSDATVWNDPALIQTFVNYIYGGVPHGFSNVSMGCLDDEAMYNADFGTSNVTKSLITSSDLSIFDVNYWNSWHTKLLNWTNAYKYIRSCNLFFEHINTTDAFADDATTKKRITGEVYFLRAYIYFDLMEMYGGVPVITKAYTLTDSFNVPRNTFAETINFITGQCDSAAALLSLTSDQGRGTKGAALALKARTLLYAASDLFNSNASWANGYAHPEFVSYVGGDRKARWQAAKDACKSVMDLGVYTLSGSLTPASADEAAKNYSNIFLQLQTSEDIFVRDFSTKVDQNWDGFNPGIYYNPNGWHGWGSGTPSQQIIDAYRMADGSKFSWSNPAEAAAPYANRDPRFYASILYEGAHWRPRPVDVAPSDPIGIIQTGKWEKWDGAQEVTVWGLDTRQSPYENWNGTYTGYFMRKFIDPTVDAQFYKQTQPWRYMRYTEVLLNYAEACIGLGEEAEAKIYLNMIRARAGMPPITSTGTQLTEDYRNERLIELAFEDQRYYDIRRWMIPEVGYEDCMGISITYPLNPDHTTSETPTYTVIDVQEREWNPRFYFLPIALDELNRNSLLVQNPLY